MSHLDVSIEEDLQIVVNFIKKIICIVLYLHTNNLNHDAGWNNEIYPIIEYLHDHEAWVDSGHAPLQVSAEVPGTRREQFYPKYRGGFYMVKLRLWAEKRALVNRILRKIRIGQFG